MNYASTKVLHSLHVKLSGVVVRLLTSLEKKTEFDSKQSLNFERQLAICNYDAITRVDNRVEKKVTKENNWCPGSPPWAQKNRSFNFSFPTAWNRV